MNHVVNGIRRFLSCTLIKRDIASLILMQNIPREALLRVWDKVGNQSFGLNRPLALRGHVTSIVFMKMKVT